MNRVIRQAMLWACAAAAADASSNRQIVLISDTHFGVGRDASGQWNNMEDARWAPEFTAFLHEIDRQGKGSTDLILNGDLFELWQSLELDCIYPDAAHQDRNLGCTEPDALHRLERAVNEHAAELRAIGEFASAGDNRVTIVPGNHDVALLFPRVAGAVLAAIGAPETRVRVAKEGYWLSPDKLIYAEHGHQIGEELNRFDNWPEPFLQRNGRTYLQRPWGEQMVQQFYNDYEKKYPVIDNFTEDSAGIGYASAAEGRAAAFEGGVRFFRFALSQVSLNQFARSLGGEGGAQEWDLAAARAQGGRFLAESLPTDDPARAVADKTLVGSTLDDMPDSEIRDLCDRRAELAAAGKQVEPCKARSLGAAAQNKFRLAKEVMSKHLDAAYARLRSAGATSQPFQLFVYSHTHFANAGFQPFDGSGRAWNPWVVNTGAWQRVASREQFEKLISARGISAADALKRIQPEDLPACYDAIVVKPYTAEPDFKLMGWKLGRDGKWTLTDPCR
jgi:hypothetical protein